MARYIGPKRRLSRREGVALFTKDVKALERKGAVPPGMHGVRGRRRISEYRVQLREKQKTKRIFGLLERQFRNYFQEARQMVSHGHISVDGKKINIPSYRVKIGQTIALSSKLGDNITSVALPLWLKKKALVGKVLRLPEQEEVEQVDERLIVEYYSR